MSWWHVLWLFRWSIIFLVYIILWDTFDNSIAVLIVWIDLPLSNLRIIKRRLELWWWHISWRLIHRHTWLLWSRHVTIDPSITVMIVWNHTWLNHHNRWLLWYHDHRLLLLHVHDWLLLSLHDRHLASTTSTVVWRNTWIILRNSTSEILLNWLPFIKWILKTF